MYGICAVVPNLPYTYRLRRRYCLKLSNMFQAWDKDNYAWWSEGSADSLA